jgi:DNA-binding beta-propeller fold protein YncE
MRTRVGLLGAVCLAWATAVQAQLDDLTSYAVYGTETVKIGPSATILNGAVGSAGTVYARKFATVEGPLAATAVQFIGTAQVVGTLFADELLNVTFAGRIVSPADIPTLSIPLPPITPGSTNIVVPRGGAQLIAPGNYGTIQIDDFAVVQLGGDIVADRLIVNGVNSQILCPGTSCAVGVQSLLQLKVGVIYGPGAIAFFYAGTKTVKVGRPGSNIDATVVAPQAQIKLKSSRGKPTDFNGRYLGRRVFVGAGASLSGGVLTPLCGDGHLAGSEECDSPDDAFCPTACQADCTCLGGPSLLQLFSIGPSVLNNATDFGVQMFGLGFQPGAQLELYDQASSALIQTLPTTFVSANELTALIPAGMPVPTGMQRELVARILNPDLVRSAPPIIGHCANDTAVSPIACTENDNCPFGSGPCIPGDQRLTMFNDRAFLNPNSTVVVPAPYGVCDNGTACDAGGDCAGIGSGDCSPKLYVTPQQVDELWIYNTGTGQFVDRSASPGIQGIPVGDNPFHVELLTVGGTPRAWVVNRFADALSIINPATDTELARIDGADLGIPGRLRMTTEIEFNRAGTRAYLSNQNLDEVLVLDIAGANRDAPALVGSIDVGVNPRGMATNTADTRLYVANVQSADISVVDIAPGSGTENQVVTTIGARASDPIVGGRADGWEPFVIGGRAPRGIAFSDDLQAVFVTSIGPQTGPRAGVNQVGGAIINPTITVIDAASNAVVAHVALNGRDPNRFKCSDPELMALDDARGRLYVTCQGSGTIDILDTAALVAAAPAELHVLALPLPTDVPVPTLAINSVVGGFGNKVCAAFTSNPGTPCVSDAGCTGCPSLREGLPVECCATNNPVGVHNGPRGVALSEDATTLFVVNQFTTSIATVDVSPADATLAAVTDTTSFPGAFGSNSAQSDRRLGQIEFSTDVKGTNTSCATCHIDDHQDGVFFEADVAGPRLRRVLSVRGTRDFPPLLQDQLLPDLVAFTDVVVHVERGGPVCQPCTELGGVFTCFPAPAGTCNFTSNAETQQNTAYSKAITFFPNPNLEPDGSLSTAVPLPGGGTGNAVNGATLFAQRGCTFCHPGPMFTIDQFRVFSPSGFSIQPLRMRDVQTPVLLPLREQCQDANRPTGVDGSVGFSVPTLRGIWDTFPLLMSGAAGLEVVGGEPSFGPCTPGSSGCCTQLQSPLNPSGTLVPPQHLALSTKDALRATLTAPLAVSGTGHGSALSLTPQQLDDLIAYLRSL